MKTIWQRATMSRSTWTTSVRGDIHRLRSSRSPGHEQPGIDVLIEQTAAVAPERLGALIGRVSHDEQTAIDHALLLALQLD
ncbi:MAG: hypothetical protein IPH38_09060 [Candidatus Microthrix sp.]|nr:hypothetical protein [Candidatus Microthrix sp.]MBK7019723.1 hypothetical protein [Candidatus Microthrix sp.]